jgi:hypothetical protein
MTLIVLSHAAEELDGEHAAGIEKRASVDQRTEEFCVRNGGGADLVRAFIAVPE